MNSNETRSPRVRSNGATQSTSAAITPELLTLTPLLMLTFHHLQPPVSSCCIAGVLLMEALHGMESLDFPNHTAPEAIIQAIVSSLRSQIGGLLSSFCSGDAGPIDERGLHMLTSHSWLKLLAVSLFLRILTLLEHKETWRIRALSGGTNESQHNSNNAFSYLGME